MNNMTGSEAVHHTTDQWNSTAALLEACPAPAGREAAWDQARVFPGTGHRDGVHLVASVLVVDVDGLVLLARHRHYRRWGPFGGHLEPNDAGSSVPRSAIEVSETCARAGTANAFSRPTQFGWWRWPPSTSHQELARYRASQLHSVNCRSGQGRGEELPSEQ